MTPAPATRTVSNSSVATAALDILVLNTGPGEGFGAQRIGGASPEFPPARPTSSPE